MTKQTITDRDTLFEELDRIQEQEYAIDDEERLAGLCCVSAPITDRTERSLGAIRVACPVHRISEDRFHNELPPPY